MVTLKKMHIIIVFNQLVDAADFSSPQAFKF